MKQLSQLDIQQVSGGLDGDEPAIGKAHTPLQHLVQPIMFPRLIKGPIGNEP